MPLQCDICGAEFTTPLQLRTHRKHGCPQAKPKAVEPQPAQPAAPIPKSAAAAPPAVQAVQAMSNSSKPQRATGGNLPDLDSPEFKALEVAAKEHTAQRNAAQEAQWKHAKECREKEEKLGTSVPQVNLMGLICEMLECREMTGRKGVAKKAPATVFDPSEAEYAKAIDDFAAALVQGPLIKNQAYFEQALAALTQDIALYYDKTKEDHKASQPPEDLNILTHADVLII